MTSAIATYLVLSYLIITLSITSKMDLHAHKPTDNIPPQRIALRGQLLLASPRFNKGTGFPRSERDSFGLEGRLPYRINSLDEQCARAWEQVQTRTTDLAKNTFLQSLKEQNWVLYYALLSRHLRALVPIIYTPTEARIILILILIHETLFWLFYRRMRLQIIHIYSGVARVFF